MSSFKHGFEKVAIAPIAGIAARQVGKSLIGRGAVKLMGGPLGAAFNATMGIGEMRNVMRKATSTTPNFKGPWMNQQFRGL